MAIASIGLGMGLQAPSGAARTEVVCLGKRATIVFGPAADTVTGTAKADVIVTGAGDDTVRGGGGNDRVCSGSGNDHLRGQVGSDRVLAGPGSDRVEGGNGSERVQGESGRDLLLGNRGNDRLGGGPGTGDVVDGGLGDDFLYGGEGDRDVVLGHHGFDRLHGGAGHADYLRGDDGGNAIDGGPGADDVVSYALAGFGTSRGGQGVDVDLSRGEARRDADLDHLTGIEDVVGSPYADVVVGDLSSNFIYGGGGPDELHGRGQEDQVDGGGGADRCEGFAQESSCGEAHSEPTVQLRVGMPGGPHARSLAVAAEPTITPQGGGITVGFLDGAWLVEASGFTVEAEDGCSLVAPTTVTCDPPEEPDAALISGGQGDDLLEVSTMVPPEIPVFMRGAGGSDVLLGGRGDDSLNGGWNDPRDVVDVVRGRGGDDVLVYGARLFGGGGSDLILGYACEGQTLSGGPGVDNLSVARGIRGLGVSAEIGGTIYMGPGRSGTGPNGCPPDWPVSRIARDVESLEGSADDDLLIGDSSPNKLIGRGGEDIIRGGGGADHIVGGNAADALFGGRGSDRLYSLDGLRDDLVQCGPGRQRHDVARADPQDPVRGCRLVRGSR